MPGPRLWTVHTRLTVYGSAILLVSGWSAFLTLEWGNFQTHRTPPPPASCSRHPLAARPLTAGFNRRLRQIGPETVAITYVLMFIGGVSASTAGGIKVSTFFLLAFAIWSEVRTEMTSTWVTAGSASSPCARP